MIQIDRQDKKSGIQTNGPTPLVVQGYLRRFLISHFSDANNIQTPELKGFIWAPSTTTNISTGVTTTLETLDSKILIEPVWKYEPNTAHQRPAIVVKRNTINTKRLSIGDQLHGIQSLLGDVDPNTHAIVSDVHSMFLFEGSCSLICLGNNGATVEALGYEVYNAFLTYVPLFLDELMLHDFQVQTLESVGKLEEDKEIFALPVTITYTYVMGKILRSEAPLLKGFSLEITGE
jgi:hypothetical protein